MKNRILTEAAEQDRATWQASFSGCTCFKAPPCQSCMHPGNPANQDEDEKCWEEIKTPEEWQKIEGVIIMDPDGWRDGTREWSDPITLTEFKHRCMRSTQMFRARDTQIK